MPLSLVLVTRQSTRSVNPNVSAQSSTIVYRRGEENMPAYDFEYDLAKKDTNLSLMQHRWPFLKMTVRLKWIRLIKTEIDTDGRLVHVEVLNSCSPATWF